MAHLPLVRQTFHITIDIETAIQVDVSESLDQTSERHYQTLVNALLARPAILRQLSRSVAIEALTPARKMLEAEYNKEGVSEQELLKPIIEQLDPDAQAYFTEEIEDNQSIYLFDGYAATIKRLSMSASDVFQE